MRDRGATRALALGLLSLPFGLLSPFAIVAGTRSLRRIASSGGSLHGRWPATLGLVAGVASLLLLLAGVALWLYVS